MSNQDNSTEQLKNKLKNLNNPEITQGIALLAHKRAEFEFNRLQTYKPQIIGTALDKIKHQPVIDKQRVISSSSSLVNQPGNIKIYPVLILAAIQSKQDISARAWFIARHCDHNSSGWIYRSDLVKYLCDLGIEAHKQKRWIDSAVSAGLLFREHKICNQDNKPVYRIASVSAAAKIFRADNKGYPVIIPISALLKRSWHAHAWAGYLATRSNKPISQIKLSEITGIAARTQQKYQRLAPVNKKRNYCQTDLDHSHLVGLREHGRSSAFVGYKQRIYFRLPDSISVPESMAKRAPKRLLAKVSNNRKKSSKLLSKIGQDKSDLIRLFHNSSKSANSALRKIDKLDRLPGNKPQEIFIKKSERQNCNLWLMLSTTG